MSKIVVAALYKFTRLDDLINKQGALLSVCKANHLKGTLLLGKEGINGTVSGSREGIDAVLTYLKSELKLSNVEHKESFAQAHPFLRMKVKLKKEIVTLGVDGVDPTQRVGTYVEPEDWNKLIEDPDVMLVDTRNVYEYRIGTFKNAIDPKITTFREFPAFVEKNLNPSQHKKIAMFCTGGIRCEKSTSYMLSQGFENVYHLKGGILKYLEKVPPKESLWEGECFVFDERVSVKHGLLPGEYDQCYGCREPITEQDKCSEFYEKGVSCPFCYQSRTQEQQAGARERQKQMGLAAQRNERHIG